jgi:general L-amino acid transport system substrate-binding protein
MRFDFVAWLGGVATVAMLASGVAAPAHAGQVLDKVRAAGKLACGVIAEVPEFNKDDLHGGLSDLGREICKAVAVAVFGDKAKMEATAFQAEQLGLQALAAGKVDLLVGVTPTATNRALHGVSFGPPIFFDAQGFIVEKSSGIASIKDLAGRKLCFIDGTDYQPALDPVMKARGIAYIPFPFQEEGEMDAALVVGHCDAVTAELSKLAEKRSTFHARAANFVFLPEMLTLDPVVPAFREGDEAWAGIVDWTVFALVQAEASGVTQQSIGTMIGSDDLAVQRLLGKDVAAARALGLPPEWAAHVIAVVGNYGEIYARAAGANSALNLPRGFNALWMQGGLMYPLPVR